MDDEKAFGLGEKLELEFRSLDLLFQKAATTSRDVLKERRVWFVRLKNNKGFFGIGEIAPIEGLSIERGADVQMLLEGLAESGLQRENFEKINLSFPSVRFGLEMALLQLSNGFQTSWFNGDFASGNKSIPINGLVWMNDCETMMKEAEVLINRGFKCIKFKVGGQDFDDELDMLQLFRAKNSSSNVVNSSRRQWAFDPSDAGYKMRLLSKYNIHSIEQPVKPIHIDCLVELCSEKIIPVALDEQLIGHYNENEKSKMLSSIKPAYIVLKPSLLGGFAECDEWIAIAHSLNIQWWVTSMLESNVGLKAIAEWTASHDNRMHQGLGTGSLFSNNIQSSLFVQDAHLTVDLNQKDVFSNIFTL